MASSAFSVSAKMPRWGQQVLSQCPNTEVSQRDGDGGTAFWVLTLRPGPPARTVTFCMFKVPFLVPIHLSLWGETPLRSCLPVLLEEECMPRAAEGGQVRRCILTAPSRTRNGCWLCLMLLGAPALCRASERFTYFLHCYTKKTQIGEIYTLNFKRFISFFLISLFQFFVCLV